MKRRQQDSAKAAKRRTTLTLPADCLKQAEQLAHLRRVSLSTVVSEALADRLRIQEDSTRSRQVLDAYKNAFAGFPEEEMFVLDGIVPESPGERD